MSNKKPAITKTEMVASIASKTGSSKKEINNFLEALTEVVHASIKSGHAITIPNITKVYVHKRAATSARQMKSPLTGELMNIPAKPARKVVKTKPVRALKDVLE